MIKCPFCDWKHRHYTLKSNGKLIDPKAAYKILEQHMEEKHNEALIQDSQREMLGDDVDYFEAAGIDNIGCK